jgi:hypothetical protein
MIKWISIGFTALVLVVGSIYFLEDRFENESDAAVTKTEVADLKEVSQEQVETLQSMQRSNDLIALETLRNQKILLKKQLDQEPNNMALEDRIERITDLIEKLENKIYQ